VYSRCPGQESRNLRVEVFKCPGCGADVEIFSDEMRFRCRKCGTMVVRKEVAPSCLDWCDAAQKCLGEGKFSELNKPGAGDKNE
jgi:DNA-directed RNA polymerase subunit RPC12/RpoP